MSEVNYVLDRLYPETNENDWGAIPKEENIFEHKYHQSNTIKAIQLTTQSKQYD